MRVGRPINPVFNFPLFSSRLALISTTTGTGNIVRASTRWRAYQMNVNDLIAELFAAVPASHPKKKGWAELLEARRNAVPTPRRGPVGGRRRAAASASRPRKTTRKAAGA